MINRIYRLIDANRINMVLREVDFNGDVIIAQPKFLSVCAADQRYFQGKRNRKTMRSKLPMALIHEATATVMHDPSGKLQIGSYIVPVPLLSSSTLSIKPNYDQQSGFRSSGKDGYLCDYIVASPSQFVPLPPDGDSVKYVFSELLSVAFNALESFEQSCITDKDSFAVWGDGSMGYVVGLLLRCMYPHAKLYVLGKTMRKLHRFSFADDVFLVDDIPYDLRIGHAFECVGSAGSEVALRQIIDVMLPQGCVSLLGVSEEEISVNTRVVLEKGLKLLGNSRSSVSDFEKAVGLISTNLVCRKYLEVLISEIIEIRNEQDITKLFEHDILNDFKTVGKWLI